MNTLTVALLVSIVALTQGQRVARMQDGHSASFAGKQSGDLMSRFGMEGMAFQPLMEKLTPDKKAQLQSILMQVADQPRSVAIPRLQKFVMSLPADLKAQFMATRQKMEQFRAYNDQRSAGLKGNAKAVYSQIMAVMNDQSLSFGESHKKSIAILSRADPKVFKDFMAAGMKMPPGMEKLMKSMMTGQFRRLRRP